MSDPIEKCAGAGEEPKGSLVRRIPVSVPLRLGHTAMHLLAILGVVCSLLYAFSMSILLQSITLFGLWYRMLWMTCKKRLKL